MCHLASRILVRMVKHAGTLPNHFQGYDMGNGVVDDVK